MEQKRNFFRVCSASHSSIMNSFVGILPSFPSSVPPMPSQMFFRVTWMGIDKNFYVYPGPKSCWYEITLSSDKCCYHTCPVTKYLRDDRVVDFFYECSPYSCLVDNIAWLWNSIFLSSLCFLSAAWSSVFPPKWLGDVGG